MAGKNKDHDTESLLESVRRLTGQVAGRIDRVRPVAEVIAEVKEEFFATIGRLASQYL